MTYEFCVTDGEGTLIDYGVAKDYSLYRFDIPDLISIAIENRHSFHAEPCDDDCETGR